MIMIVVTMMMMTQGRIELENEWKRAAMEKKQRDEQEANFRKMHPGIPILDQIAHYARCNTYDLTQSTIDVFR